MLLFSTPVAEDTHSKWLPVLMLSVERFKKFISEKQGSETTALQGALSSREKNWASSYFLRDNPTSPNIYTNKFRIDWVLPPKKNHSGTLPLLAPIDISSMTRLGPGAACGSVAGGIAGGVTTPLDVAKTRIMLEKVEEGVLSSEFHRIQSPRLPRLKTVKET